jgi:hypothetical protein
MARRDPDARVRENDPVLGPEHERLRRTALQARIVQRTDLLLRRAKKQCSGGKASIATRLLGNELDGSGLHFTQGL